MCGCSGKISRALPGSHHFLSWYTKYALIAYIRSKEDTPRRQQPGRASTMYNNREDLNA